MLEKILKKQGMPISLRLVGLLFFLLILFGLFYGSVKILSFNFTSNLAMILVWTLWWPFLYITIFFIARGWCGFLCPLSLANEAGNYIRFGKKKAKTINFLKWGFIAYIIFFIVVYTEQVSGLFLSVSMTITFFLIFLLSAFLIGILFARFSFCRLFCPIGTLLGVFSRLSMIGVRTNKDICKTCKTKECLVGGKTAPCPMFNNVPNLESNRNCLICTNCIKNCPHDSAKLGFVYPGKEIEKQAEFSLSESLFIISLFGLTSVLTTEGTMMFRGVLSIFGISLRGALLRGADFILAVLFFISVYFIAVFIMSKLSKMELRPALTKNGYAYLPLVFAIMFFTITFGFLGPWINISETAMAAVKYIFLSIGVVWSLVLAYKIAGKSANKIASAPNFILILAIGALWMFAFISGPLNLVQAEETVLIVESGEVINMDAFSMGYSPSIIKTKKGAKVMLNITNIDINHAFDIDEFNVHMVIVGGRTATVMFDAEKTGEFEFYCGIPGHKEAGMKGKLIVEE